MVPVGGGHWASALVAQSSYEANSRYVPKDRRKLTQFYAWVTAVTGAVAVNSAVPLFFELCVEETFPIPEATSIGVLVLIQNIVQSLFLFIPIGTVGEFERLSSLS